MTSPIAYEEIVNRDQHVYVADIDNQAQIAEVFLKMYGAWEKETEAVLYSSTVWVTGLVPST